MYNSIQYRISNNLIAYHVIPFTNRQLTCNNCSLSPMSVLYDFHKIVLLLPL